MNIENPLAFSFIMQDEIYLLNSDKEKYSNIAAVQPAAEVLTETIIPQQPIVETLPVSFNYLGGHKKGFLILVHYPAVDFIYDKHLTALTSTLSRLGFGMDDVAIFNRATYIDAEFEVIHEFFKPQKMLVLGKSSLPRDLEAPLLNSVVQKPAHRILFTFSFDEMMESNENKKAFWEQMKQL
ncbi:hypothetical protein [Mucilaginibacter sp.]|uniref:hypothetical protein n=1 Tax=Mucilaginibacter sp. TaxID=1882438 RepID=UPI003D0F4065